MAEKCLKSNFYILVINMLVEWSIILATDRHRPLQSIQYKKRIFMQTIAQLEIILMEHQKT